MTAKLYYLRDNRTARIDSVGTQHRANPVAVVASDVNRENNTIRYAVAIVHKGDTFRKDFARHIVLERLNGLDKNEKSKALRAGDSTKSCAGARMIVSNQLPASAHDLTSLVMHDIFKSIDLPDKLRNLAADWLDLEEERKSSMEADKVPTIPVPAYDKPMRRDAIPPPPLVPNYCPCMMTPCPHTPYIPLVR